MNRLDQSSLRIKNGIPYFSNPELERLGWVIHGFLTRQGGVSSPPFHSLNVGLNSGDKKENIIENLRLITNAFEFGKSRLVLLKQMQKDGILSIRIPDEPLPSTLHNDAMITNLPNLLLGIKTADCLPIFIVDIRRKVISAIHAGRQGTALGITKKVLRKMKEEWGCSEESLLVTLGPSIGPCCYEVDEKVFQVEWEPFSIPAGTGRWRIDLAEINIFQMKEEGIQEEQIWKMDLCTRCHSNLFFSYRGEGRTGRQLSFIGMTSFNK